MNETYLGTTSSASALFDCVIVNIVIEIIKGLEILVSDFNLLVQLYATGVQGCLLVSLINIASIHRLRLP